MAIFKAKLESNYTTIPNETLQDRAISFEAKGLLILMLSLPDNWEIKKSWLERQSPNCKRDKLTRLIKELEDAGYIKKKAVRLECGKFNGWNWLVYPESQTEKPLTDSPSTENPLFGKGVVEEKRNTSTNKTLLTKETLEKAGFEWPSNLDEGVWLEWIQYRKEIKKTISIVNKITIGKQLKFLSEQKDPAATINNSIKNGWAGLFELKGGSNPVKRSVNDLSGMDYSKEEF